MRYDLQEAGMTKTEKEAAIAEAVQELDEMRERWPSFASVRASEILLALLVRLGADEVTKAYDRAAARLDF
jgi:hypothetical protein